MTSSENDHKVVKIAILTISSDYEDEKRLSHEWTWFDFPWKTKPVDQDN